MKILIEKEVNVADLLNLGEIQDLISDQIGDKLEDNTLYDAYYDSKNDTFYKEINKEAIKYVKENL